MSRQLISAGEEPVSRRRGTSKPPERNQKTRQCKRGHLKNAFGWWWVPHKSEKPTVSTRHTMAGYLYILAVIHDLESSHRPLAVRIDKALPSRASFIRARARARARKRLPTDYRTGGLLVDTVTISEPDSSRNASKTGHGQGHGKEHRSKTFALAAGRIQERF